MSDQNNSPRPSTSLRSLDFRIKRSSNSELLVLGVKFTEDKYWNYIEGPRYQNLNNHPLQVADWIRSICGTVP